MHPDDSKPMRDRRDSAEKREGVLARVRAIARGLGARLRKALGHDDDTRPPGFNGAMLVA